MNEAMQKPALMVIEGGKGPTSVNWLRDMNAGVVFSCRQKDYKGFQVECFEIILHREKTTMLGFTNAVGMKGTMDVDSFRFSKDMELVDILGFVPQEKEETNEHYRTDRPADMDHYD